MFFIAYPIVILVIFALLVRYAWTTVSNLQHTAAIYTARLLPFANFSLSSWILWVLQSLILAGLFMFFPIGFFHDAGLWLGVMQNALWTSAILSLRLKQFSRMTTLPIWKVFPVVIVLAFLTYRSAVLNSQAFFYIDTVLAFTIFTSFAYSIMQWRLSKISAAAFFIHGYSQWIWKYLWATPWTGTHTVLLVAFSLWHIALLVAWIKLISAMIERAEPSYREVIRDIEQLSLPKPLNTFQVMISSTMDDLAQERDAVASAIENLHLTQIGTESLGLPDTRRNTSVLLAQQCDIFILIIGERYRDMVEPEGISVVEFEYKVAREQNAGKILVYVKDGVNRDAPLEKFLQRLEEFEHRYFRSLSTPENFYEKTQRDLARWLASHVSINTSRDHQTKGKNS